MFKLHRCWFTITLDQRGRLRTHHDLLHLPGRTIDLDGIFPGRFLQVVLNPTKLRPRLPPRIQGRIRTHSSPSQIPLHPAIEIVVAVRTPHDHILRVHDNIQTPSVIPFQSGRTVNQHKRRRLRCKQNFDRSHPDRIARQRHFPSPQLQ